MQVADRIFDESGVTTVGEPYHQRHRDIGVVYQLPMSDVIVMVCQTFTVVSGEDNQGLCGKEYPYRIHHQG